MAGRSHWNTATPTPPTPPPLPSLPSPPSPPLPTCSWLARGRPCSCTHDAKPKSQGTLRLTRTHQGHQESGTLQHAPCRQVEVLHCLQSRSCQVSLKEPPCQCSASWRVPVSSESLAHQPWAKWQQRKTPRMSVCSAVIPETQLPAP